MTILLIAIGGVFGAVARYKLGEVLAKRSRSGFPIGTLLINLSGALVLGILTGMRLEGNWYALLGEGFCGAFTTFSSFSLDTVHLLRARKRNRAALYVVLTVVLGILCFLVGYGVAA